MFREALSSVVSSLGQSVRDTAGSYKPTSDNIHGSFERLAQIGIGNLSFRSPLMADVAEQVLKNFQIVSEKKSKMRDYLKSSESEGIREKIKASMPENTSSKKIDEQITKILTKIDRQVETSKDDSYKQSEVFKEYEKFFNEFKSATTKELKENNSATSNDTTTTTTNNTNGGVVDNDALNKIQINTQRTVNVLEEMVARRNVVGGEGGQVGTKQGATFIDPMTGLPSMRAAMGSIGGSFLGKVFDDDVIERIAKKTRKIFRIDGDEESEIVRKEDTSTTIQDVLNEKSSKILNEDITRKEDTSTTVLPVENNSESAKESSQQITKQSEKLQGTVESILEELREIHSIIKKEDSVEGKKEDSILDSVLDAATGKRSPRTKRKPGILLPPNLPDSLDLPGTPDKHTRTGPVAKKAPAPSRGYSIGKRIGQTARAGVELGKKGVTGALSVGKSAIGVGAKILSASGSFLSALNPATKVIGAGALGVAAGTAIYNSNAEKIQDVLANVFKSDSEKKLEASEASFKVAQAKVNNIQPKLAVNNIDKLSDIKAEKQAAKTEKASQPIIINNTSNTQSGGSPPPVISVTSGVRNKDSTFERVQMQNFWSRSA